MKRFKCVGMSSRESLIMALHNTLQCVSKDKEPERYNAFTGTSHSKYIRKEKNKKMLSDVVYDYSGRITAM